MSGTEPSRSWTVYFLCLWHGSFRIPSWEILCLLCASLNGKSWWSWLFILIIFLLNSILLSNGIPSVVYLKEIRFHEFLEVVYYFQGSVSLHCHLGNPLYAVNKIWKQKPCLFYLNLGISVPLICHYIINRTFPNGGKLHYFYHQILVVPDIILSSY